MKSVLASIAVSGLLAAAALAQPHYVVTDLGVLPGGNFSQATYLNNNRLLAGLSSVADGTQHAVLWGGPFRMDVGAPGVNSGAFGVNERGQASIQAEGSDPDPNNENFCAYGTARKCLAFRWGLSGLVQLPTLGGNNATVGNINSRGEIPGVAENASRDPECPPGVAVTGTGPQVLNYRAVIWGPGPKDIRELAPLPGDSVSVALFMNDSGQAVGGSGRCGNTLFPPLAAAPHAVLWEADGSVHDLGNLGGPVDMSIPVGNMALGISNAGQVVGAASVPGPGFHAFLWTKQTARMQDLGTYPGDVASGAVGINDRGQIVGQSFDANGHPRPVLWQDGTPYDLNDQVVGGAPLHLLWPTWINSRGEISGFGVTGDGDIHAFLATPANANDGVRDSARKVAPTYSLPRHR